MGLNRYTEGWENRLRHRMVTLAIFSECLTHQAEALAKEIEMAELFGLCGAAEMCLDRAEEKLAALDRRATYLRERKEEADDAKS